MGDAILLCGCERDHPHRVRVRVVLNACVMRRRTGVRSMALDTIANVCFTRCFVPILTYRRKLKVADRTYVPLVDMMPAPA